MTRTRWSDQENKIMREIYPNSYAIDVAKKLGRSVQSVYAQAAKLGLSKSPEWMDAELRFRQGERLKESGAKHRFKKGQSPVNKGVPMSDEKYHKVSRTMFKKGNLPVNRKYDGHERISVDGYIEVRVISGKYVAKHRMIWESVHGKIPDSMVISFRDRNPLNVDISNLEMIHRSELMNRNTIHQYPEPLKDVIKSLNKLKKLVHEKQN